jgi:hypothetical protein
VTKEVLDEEKMVENYFHDRGDLIPVFKIIIHIVVRKCYSTGHSDLISLIFHKNKF